MLIKNAEFVKGIVGTDELLENDVLQVAFYGRSNAGKSSSINALLGRNNLVKSSSTPGKTKELNLFEINETFFIVDLPGYGYAKVSKDDREKLRKLIEWYILDCNVVNRVNVLVIDGKVGLTEMDEKILQTFADIKEKCIILMNKTDKLKQKDLSKNLKKLKEKVGKSAEIVVFSATRKTGVSEFWKKFSQ
jgi:GTP-binding protein